MPDHGSTQSPGAAISNHVVKVQSHYTGRGPTRARTYIEQDLVTVVTESNLTRGEQHLLQAGLDEQVEGLRLSIQKTMREELIAGVEKILKRRVRAFLSANHLEPDIAVETFVLHPEAE